MHERLGGWEYGLSQETINNFRQNSPELVVRDAKRMLSLTDEQCETLRLILLARGINKWLKARRDIIQFKHDIKNDIKTLQQNYQKWNPAHKETLKLMNKYREQVRSICHQPRWVIWPRIASAEKAEKKIIISGNRT